jgi:hypothetical protein
MKPYIDQDPVDIVFALLERREKQLKRVIAKQRTRLERDRWHPWPEDRGIKRHGDYLIIDRFGSYSIGLVYHGVWHDEEGNELECITHWRELPPGPEECIE